MKMKSGLLLLCVLVGLSAKAQNWGGGVDDTNLHFGFTFQYLSSEYKILKKYDPENGINWRDSYTGDLDAGVLGPGTLNAISSEPSPGFGIGFVVNKRLIENTDLRFTPILVFNDRILTYHYNKENVEKKVSSTLVEFPLGVKIKSDRRNNFRAYVLGGAKYSMDISSRKKTNNDLIDNPELKMVNNIRNYLSYEAGLGFDLYFEYFKMSPEIKLSYSFNSVLKEEKILNRYSYPIDKLMLRHVTFSLFFE